MLKLEGTIQRCMYDSQRFFRNTRIVHIVLAVLLIAIGTTALVLSNGSDGTAKVPYFFSAYIAAVWHIVFVVLCQVCMYFLAENGDRGPAAPAWVRAYSVSSSLFVLFNVMGVVFTVVNGICIEDQLCYYDKNHTSNRLMAVILIILHCVSIVFSVFLAKRTHLIDSELNNDIGIKLNQVMNFLRTRRNNSTVSVVRSEGSGDRQTTSSPSSNQTDAGLSHVQNKGGHVLTTIEISAQRKTKTHRRSKSQPNMVKQLGLLNPDDIKGGQVVSIYSDTETHEQSDSHKKKRKSKHLKPSKITPRTRRSKSENNVENLPSDDESFSSSEKAVISISSKKHSLTITSTTKDGGDIDPGEKVLFVRSVGMDDAAYKQQKLLMRQEKLQKQQEKLYEEQRKLFLAQKREQTEGSSINGAPPPYDASDDVTKSNGDDDDVLL